MKKLLVIIMLLSMSSMSYAADRGTADEAVSLVRKVIAAIKQNGREKTLEEIKAGKHIDRDLYPVIVDQHGTALANGINPRLIGKDLSLLKDSDGKEFMKEAIDEAKRNGKGWVDYKWPNPTTSRMERKSNYFERIDNLIVTCGYYKGE